MAIPTGKGVWIWQVWRLEGGSIDDPAIEAIVEQLVASQTSHVYLKVADGSYPYNVKWGNYPYWSGPIQADLAADLTDALQQALIQVLGWQYVRGTRPLDEANVAVQRVQQLGQDGFSIDAEAEYKLAGKDAAAELYSKELRAGLGPNLPISLATYRYPSLHKELPYGPFLRRCDYNAQQLYWEGAHNPVAQLVKSLAEYNTLMAGLGINPPLPQCPIGSAYGTGSWLSTPDDVTAFLQGCVDRGLPSASLWSMDWMRAHPASGLWEAYADFEWPEEMPEPEPEPDPEPEPIPDDAAEYLLEQASKLDDISAGMRAKADEW